MKQVLAAAAVMLLAGTSIGFAQQGEIYLNQDESGAYRIYGPDNMEGAELLVGENGAAPSVCPEGSYWRNADNMVVGCGTDEALGLAPIEEGTMMPDGQPFPSTAFWLQPNGMPINADGADDNVSTDAGAMPSSEGGTTGSIGGNQGDGGGNGDGSSN